MSAKISSLLVTLCVAGFCAGLYAQERGDVFTVGLPHEVVVGDKILPVGSWDIRWEGSRANPTLKFYRGNVMNAEIAALSITSEDNKKSGVTEAVIERIGPDYYLTKIWIKGERTGYAFRLGPQTGSLQHADVQRIPATFVSGSWFAQNASMEGQARSHAAQGLGNPDDRHQKGVVVARTFTPALPESDVAATLPDERGSRPIALNEERSESAPSSSGALARSEDPFISEDRNEAALTPAEALPAADEAALNRTSDVEGSSNRETPGSPALQDEVALNQNADPNYSNVDESGESAEEAQTDVAELTPSEEPEVIQTAAAEPPELEGLPEALPATASYWPAFVLIGFTLIGLSFMVRRRV